jgi:hypothetical protein
MTDLSKSAGPVYHLTVAPVIAVLVVAGLAVLSAERRILWLHVLSKPLTTALLLLIVGWPATRLAWWIDAGISWRTSPTCWRSWGWRSGHPTSRSSPW